MLRRKPIEETCEITGEVFEITPEQREAYEYFDLPLPKVSPSERLRHQLSFCSDHQLFWRRCSETSKRMITSYTPKSQFNIVDLEYWNSPEWDASKYGRNYNFESVFVDQLLELWHQVPRPSLNSFRSEDSADCNDVFEVKHCSMIFNSAYCNGCFHSSHMLRCDNCVDCHSASDSKWCFQSTYIDNCTRVGWAYDLKGCSDSYFLSNSSDCSNCMFCVNLSNAKYCLFNEQLSKKEYEAAVAKWDFSTHEGVLLAQRSYHAFLQEHPIAHIASDDPKTTSGNYLRSCSRTTNSFECNECDNCIDCNLLMDANNCLDCTGIGIGTEFCAQSIGVGFNARRIVNSVACWDNVEDLEYCSHCSNSRYLFACVGLNGAEYCIFNKQYSKEEYERLRLSIVARLKERDIWGRFLPAAFSAYEYNNSLAQVLMPLAKVPAQMLGFRWDSSDPLVRPSQLKSRMGTDYHLAQVPSGVDALDGPSASREVFLCELTGQPYTLSLAERELYKELKVAAPRRSPERRFEERMLQLAPRVLEERDGMQTSFPADWFRPVLPHREWAQRVAKKK